MKEDIFSIYPILKFIIGIFFCLVGVAICIENKFYIYNANDMFFATKMKIFLSGLLFIMIGIFAFINYFFGPF